MKFHTEQAEKVFKELKPEPMTEAKKEELEESAKRWEVYAASEANHHMRRTAYKVADTFRIEILTGVAVCVCCMKPSAGQTHPHPVRVTA